MVQKLNSADMMSWLKDFDYRSTTEIVDNNKEKDEIIAIAKAKMGIDLTNNPDLAGFKTIYTFSNKPNGNGARAPKDLILKALPTLIGKAVNIDHIQNYVVGYYIDYKYLMAEDKVIAYGLFFKTNFGDEWQEAKALLKQKKLGTSHEIWCPPKYRKQLPDGTYEMQHIEFAGGALIYRNHDDKQKPGFKMKTAYPNCDVLAIAKLQCERKPSDLVFASLDQSNSKYKEGDLLISSEAQEFVKRVKQEMTEKIESGFIKEHENVEPVKEVIELTPMSPAPVVPESKNEEVSEIVENKVEPIESTPIVPDVPKITCKHCNHVYETLDVGELSCPECKSIIDRQGNVLYPPQKIDFNFRDPEDGSSNWRLIEREEDYAIIKNLDSSKIYKLNFTKDVNDNELIKQLNFVYMGEAECPQCGNYQTISAPSNVDAVELKCTKCNLKYHKNISKASKKILISDYEDISETYIKKVEPVNKYDIKDLQVASLHYDNILDLEVASMLNPRTVNLELASLSFSKKDKKFSTSKISKLQNKINKPTSDYTIKAKLLIKKLVSKIRKQRKEANLEKASLKSTSGLEIAKIKESAEEKISFYMNNAKNILVRRENLGAFASDLTDKDIMDENIFALTKKEKENALLKASLNNELDIIGDKSILAKDGGTLNKLKEEIDRKAFGGQI